MAEGLTGKLSGQGVKEEKNGQGAEMAKTKWPIGKDFAQRLSGVSSRLYPDSALYFVI